MRSRDPGISIRSAEQGGVLVQMQVPLKYARCIGIDEPPIHLVLVTTRKGKELRLSKEGSKGGRLLASTDKILIVDDFLKVTFHLNGRQFRKVRQLCPDFIPRRIDLDHKERTLLRYGLDVFEVDYDDKTYHVVMMHDPELIIDEDSDVAAIVTPVTSDGKWQDAASPPMYIDCTGQPTWTVPPIEYVTVRPKQIRCTTPYELSIFEVDQTSWDRVLQWLDERGAREQSEGN